METVVDKDAQPELDMLGYSQPVEVAKQRSFVL